MASPSRPLEPEPVAESQPKPAPESTVSAQQSTARTAPDEILVQGYLKRERARREAQRRLDAEEHPPVVPPPVLTLRDRLALPPSTTRFRIEGWQPVDARVMLTAQYKAGKTTLVMNLVRSLVTGDPFLGVAAVTPLDGSVLVIDAEMSPKQLDEWYREAGIEHDNRVLIWPLRGKLSAFGLLDPTVRAGWAARLRALGVRYLVLDCLRPFLDAFGLDEQHDGGKFLVALDALLVEAEIPEALVVHHMGHGAERSRGDSRLRDWPDVEWKIVRKVKKAGNSVEDDPAARRFISGYGRDVNVTESALAFDLWRHLTLTEGGGSRKDADTQEALANALDTLARGEQPSFNKLVEAVKEVSHQSRDIIRGAIKLGIKQGRIVTGEGPRNAQIHRIPPPSIERGQG